MEKKICTKCKQELPKTKEYFAMRTMRQVNKNGVIAVYTFFRSACKECLNKQTSQLNSKRYYENHESSLNKNKENYIKYRDKKVRYSRAYRKEHRVRLILNDRKRIETLDDAWIASIIGIPLNECPKGLIENKKIVIKIKREIKKQQDGS